MQQSSHRMSFSGIWHAAIIERSDLLVCLCVRQSIRMPLHRSQGKAFDTCIDILVDKLCCSKEQHACPVFISFRVSEASKEAALLQVRMRTSEERDLHPAFSDSRCVLHHAGSPGETWRRCIRLQQRPHEARAWRELGRRHHGGYAQVRTTGDMTGRFSAASSLALPLMPPTSRSGDPSAA